MNRPKSQVFHEEIRLLAESKVIPFGPPPNRREVLQAQKVARYRLAEYAKRKEQASVRTSESPESAQTGTDAETSTANNLGERTKQG